MKKISLKYVLMSFLTIAFAFSAGSTFAVNAAQRPDLDVEIQNPASAFVNSPYVYTVDVANVGNRNATNVSLTVEFPLTNTSPQVFILGDLTGISNNCQIANNKLECNLGTIKKNKSNSISFNFAIPVSMQTPQIKATATTITPGEIVLGNNTDTIVQNLSYATNQISSANLLNSHCTGQNLTSYFECEQFPSSIQQHTATLNSNGTITLPYQGYTGSWNQPTAQQLYFQYRDSGNNIVAEFNGYATGTTCFEGMTTFPQNPNYVSPYKVCIQ